MGLFSFSLAPHTINFHLHTVNVNYTIALTNHFTFILHSIMKEANEYLSNNAVKSQTDILLFIFFGTGTFLTGWI